MKWFTELDFKIQAVIISSVTSLLIFGLGWIIRAIYERTSLNYKLRKEYQFEQKKKLKEEIAKNKTHLLNTVEEFNHRLWNFSQHNENWHQITEENWGKTQQYYIKSFVYRFLKFLHWTLKTENDTISIDTTIADKNEILFLKYIKTFKDIFTDADLLEELNYDKRHNTNHFFKNDLIGMTKWILEGERVIDFDEFETIIEMNYDGMRETIEYFTKIQHADDDKNLNILRCCHLICIQFLNSFGHDYQKTEEDKIRTITELYKGKIKIKKGFKIFVTKSKLGKEMKNVMCKITKA
ncbi:hypothetical protein [Tenacibaculum crassostreae]|uniref:hypothetical protein n=1 Tax=Tenacibaculum crassostreae TaxID=502683 RepID=UPI0038932D10